MKQNETWDPRTLLKFVNSIGKNATLTLQQLTYKTVGLLTLLSGSRVHCVHAFSTLCMTRSEGCYTFYPTVFLKHSRPKFRGKPISYRLYPHNPKLCVVKAVHEYISHKRMVCKTDALLVAHRGPHRSAHRYTGAQWLKNY